MRLSNDRIRRLRRPLRSQPSEATTWRRLVSRHSNVSSFSVEYSGPDESRGVTPVDQHQISARFPHPSASGQFWSHQPDSPTIRAGLSGYQPHSRRCIVAGHSEPSANLRTCRGTQRAKVSEVVPDGSACTPARDTGRLDPSRLGCEHSNRMLGAAGGADEPLCPSPPAERTERADIPNAISTYEVKRPVAALCAVKGSFFLASIQEIATDSDHK